MGKLHCGALLRQQLLLAFAGRGRRGNAAHLVSRGGRAILCGVAYYFQGAPWPSQQHDSRACCVVYASARAPHLAALPLARTATLSLFGIRYADGLSRNWMPFGGLHSRRESPAIRPPGLRPSKFARIYLLPLRTFDVLAFACARLSLLVSLRLHGRVATVGDVDRANGGTRRPISVGLDQLEMGSIHRNHLLLLILV